MPMPMSMMVTLATRATSDTPRCERTSARRLVAFEDLLDIVARLAERRDAAVALHRPRTGVIRSQGAFDVAAVLLEEGIQVPRAAVEVRGRVEGILDAELTGRAGHQLHEPLGTLARDGIGAEAGLHGDHGQDEGG